MKVRMLRHRVWQDAGAERHLNVGEEHDLPDVVGCAFIATGAAEAVAPPEPGALVPAGPAHARRKTRAAASAPEQKGS